MEHAVIKSPHHHAAASHCMLAFVAGALHVSATPSSAVPPDHQLSTTPATVVHIPSPPTHSVDARSDILLSSIAHVLPLASDGLTFQPDPKAPLASPTSNSHAPTEGGDAAELSKKLSNPIADLISIPFQLNYDEGFGPKDAGQWRLNIQPVIPFNLTDEWNLITRTIVPVIDRESFGPGDDDEFGLGDTVQSFFFAPAKPIDGWIIGAGPVFNWPTATEDSLGSRQWGMGPTVVALRQEHGWTYGVLANHVWSIAGESDHEEINSTFLQPFVSYTWPSATSLTLNTESTYDWNEGDWTIPVNLVGGQIFKLGKLPLQFQLGGRYYADSPEGGPEWGIRLGIVILLPK